MMNGLLCVHHVRPTLVAKFRVSASMCIVDDGPSVGHCRGVTVYQLVKHNTQLEMIGNLPEVIPTCAHTETEHPEGDISCLSPSPSSLLRQNISVNLTLVFQLGG